MSKPKRDVDGIVHSHPGSVDQQSEDSFPASDSPSSSPGAIGAPQKRESTPPTGQSDEVKNAEQKVRTGETKVPHKY